MVCNGKNYRDNIAITQALLRSMAPYTHSETAHFFETFSEITMDELFEETVGICLGDCPDLDVFKQVFTAAGFKEYADKSETWEELFDYIFVGHVERSIPIDKTVFIKDYLVQIPTTAKRNGPIYERWEFYMNGWEMANCYTEEFRYEEMYQLFRKEEAFKNKMMTPHFVNYDYLDIFKGSFPACSGVAMGVDRVFAAFINAKSLDETSLFPFGSQLQ